MKNHWIALGFTSVALLLGSCGGDDEKDDEPTVVYATMVVANSTVEVENGSFELTGSSCKFDGNTGLLTTKFTGANNRSLDVKIKGFEKADKSYTCAQSSANPTSSDVSTDNYSSCAVSFNLLEEEGKAGANTYGIYRTANTQAEFTYGGACSVEMTYNSVTSKIAGTISCTKMIQTHYAGSVWPKYEDPDTADLASGSKFECKI